MLRRQCERVRYKTPWGVELYSNLSPSLGLRCYVIGMLPLLSLCWIILLYSKHLPAQNFFTCILVLKISLSYVLLYKDSDFLVVLDCQSISLEKDIRIVSRSILKVKDISVLIVGFVVSLIYEWLINIMLNHAMYAVLKLSINILKKQVLECLSIYILVI